MVREECSGRFCLGSHWGSGLRLRRNLALGHQWGQTCWTCRVKRGCTTHLEQQSLGFTRTFSSIPSLNEMSLMFCGNHEEVTDLDVRETCAPSWWGIILAEL